MKHIFTILFLISLHASGQLRNPGQLVPLGGTTGQVLKKNSATNWDISWATNAGGGDMLAENNLSDLVNATTARTNLGVNTTANISNSTNKNFVTDAHLTVLGNTSGSNSGDQTGIVGITGTLAQFNTAVTDGNIQPEDADLTTISGLTATTDNFLVGVSSAWASRTPAQVKTTLAINLIDNTSDANKPVSTATQAALDTKQATLVSGTNIKTINGSTVLGSGDLVVSGSDSRLTATSLASDHAISSTTATEVTLGATGLVAGTYIFTYYLLVRSATTTVSPMYGINFTGTAAVRKMTLRYSSTGTSASTGVADDVVAAPLATGNVYESQPVTAFTTTAPNMGHTAAVAAINVDIFVIIEGIMIVTATGDLELWHSSETATSTTIKAGSSLVLIKTN